ncbi:uncharacterized protein LOC108146861 isoform X1 [Drosophila elegans]|uniref:uncharacterized protein LOC108146861 isoform X1 n=1 Tax=Drosophila elegans TaxID=30023 RepID=UPI0007E863C4|nr:uncharacterized protein LOC108146861 isoform X1 [Drosophila elegans]
MEQTTSSSMAELAQNGEEMETDASKVPVHQEYAEALSISGRSGKRRWSKRWCRAREVLSVGAIFIALLLIIGAIYMHLRQKHRLGRLHITLKDRERVDDGLAAEDEDFHLVTAAAVAAQTITTFRPSPSSSQPSDECLACMATTATDNIPAICGNRGRGKEPCGIYRISHGYWQDALRTIDTDDSLAQDYERCVVVKDCAERIVRGYVQRYGWDCNGDGRIECRDHVILHMRGPGGCRRQKPLGEGNENRLENCLKYKGMV